MEIEMDKRRNTDVIVETLKLEGKRVIDVGCGDGALARVLTRFGAHVLGVECSPRQLAKARAAEKAGDEEIVEGVGQNLPANDDEADIVVFFNSLHHIPIEHQAKAMAEASRVLKPNGEVYVSEPLPFGAFFEAVRPIDDETWVRGAALAAIKGAWVHGLEEETEFSYIHPLILRDYETFRDRIVSANSEREARFAEMDAEMRDRFARLASPGPEGGFLFEQPMRVNLLRKA
jgi:SAM-dependent methyltransferase